MRKFLGVAVMVAACLTSCAGDDTGKKCEEVFEKARRSEFPLGIFAEKAAFVDNCKSGWKSYASVHSECLSRPDREFEDCMQQYMFGGSKNNPL